MKSKISSLAMIVPLSIAYGFTNRLRLIKLLASLSVLVCIGFLLGCDSNEAGINAQPSVGGKVVSWTTSGDQSNLLDRQDTISLVEVSSLPAGASTVSIQLLPDQQFQEMDGFGFTLTGGSAVLLSRMSATSRSQLLTDLFSPQEIGINYLRISIGASDLDSMVFSYNDLPAGETDFELNSFSIDEDKKHLIPMLKEILAINPSLKILGSPWSPPAWMKTNSSTIGGSLKENCYQVYADYLARYITAMAGEGVIVDAITVQNEPLHPGNNPSLLMPADQQLVFVRDFLGPKFKSESIATKIIIYDHNCDRPDYPLTILADAEARQFVDGSAFHLYGGEITALTTVHDAYPEKHVYFTEQYTNSNGEFAGDLMWHSKALHVGAPNNWAKNVLEWNLASDPEQSIFTPGGCSVCLGAVTIAGDSVKRNIAYYSVAHSSLIAAAGAHRIGLAATSELPAVAYKNQDGSYGLMIVNEEQQAKEITVGDGSSIFTARIPAQSVMSFSW